MVGECGRLQSGGVVVRTITARNGSRWGFGLLDTQRPLLFDKNLKRKAIKQESEECLYRQREFCIQFK